MVAASKYMDHASNNHKESTGFMELNHPVPKSELKPLRAVIYARVSSQEQVKKEFSIPEMQIPQCKELLKEKDWRFVKCYIDQGFDGNAFLK
ncbi:MAG: recombinase family protein, partial [Planctomycetota bacterium]